MSGKTGAPQSSARILFVGASELGYRCCERLIEQGHHVAGIMTAPREFRISYSPDRPVVNVLHRDFHQLGARFDIPVVTLAGKMSDHHDEIATLSPDLIIVIGWYHMVPRRMRDLAALGCVGIHASLLPIYRGGAPLVWAMIHGETESGVTLFHFADGVDDGDIVGQESFAIERDDTIRQVLDKAGDACLTLLDRFVPLLATGEAPRIPQDHSQATSFPQRSPADGRIDWSWEPERIHNFVRAQTKPYPGAFTEINGLKVTIWSADVERADRTGEVLVDRPEKRLGRQ